ncbi:manganese transport protein MntH, partial [Aeromonas salmonicida subsp. salmonicida]
IYLHSALTQHTQDQGTVPQRLHTTRVDVAIAMTIAGFVNLAMMAMAAAAFHSSGNQQVAELESAYQTLTPLLGQAAATLFGLSLVASGISSTVVGTLAGQVVMQGFVRFTIPLWLRRAITMAPAFVVIAMGLNTTEILVLSQVVLSFGIALALIPLLILTGDRALMGEYRNHPVTQAVGRLIVALVIGLNAYLLVAMI